LFGDQSISIIKQLDKILKKNKANPPDEETDPFEKLVKDIIKNELFGYTIEWRDEYKNIFHAVSVLGYVLGNNQPIRLEEKLPEITSKIEKEIDKDLTERSTRTFQFMNEKTTNDAYEIIKRGMQRSDTLQQIAEKISNLYSDENKIMYRANRIARTEALSALSIGQNRSMQIASKLIPDLQKMWVSTEDNRTRGNPNGLYNDSKCDHWNLHGQVVNHDETFTEPRTNESLEFPRDPKGSASNVINCRCTWIALPAKDMAKFQKQESEAQPHE